MGIALIMLFAAIFHISRGEFSAIAINAVILGIAVFIAGEGVKKLPFFQNIEL